MEKVSLQDIIRWPVEDMRPADSINEDRVAYFIDILYCFGVLEEVGWTALDFWDFMNGKRNDIPEALVDTLNKVFEFNDEKTKLLYEKYGSKGA